MHFKRLETLEFTSNRKRMSVIIRDSHQQIWLYTKGAESHVFPLCVNTPAQVNLIRATRKHIDDFANVGLRTLAVARRKLSVDEYRQYISGKLVATVIDYLQKITKIIRIFSQI